MQQKEHRDLCAVLAASETKLKSWESQVRNDRVPPRHLEESSVAALADVAKLVHAHTTRVALAFKPPITIDAANKSIAETLDLVPGPLMGALAGLIEAEAEAAREAKKQNPKFVDIFVSEMQARVGAVIAALRELTVKLQAAVVAEEQLLNNERAPSANPQTSSDVLTAVGMLWEACNAIGAVCEMGRSGLLKSKIKTYGELLQDSLEELSEWIESPDDVDIDPFGSEQDSKPLQNIDEQLALAKIWHESIRRLSILYRAVCPKRAESLSSSDINLLSIHLVTMSAQIDEVVAAFFERQPLNRVHKEIAIFNKQVRELLVIIGRGADDKTTAQLTMFSDKFFDSIDFDA